MPKIDKKNISIINMLMDDGRMSCSEIAKKMGNITERSVQYRINRLVSENVIKICAVPSAEKLGFPVIADIYIEVESANIEEVAKTLAEYECVAYVACSIGNPDVSIQIFSPDNSTVFRFATEIVGKMPGVIKTKTLILPTILKANSQWRVPITFEHEFKRVKKSQ
ncbi:winged helix-turn-helix transcriptional regulator [bacterium]|nr:winged helix-turn-helix transcriptional regulator [bacterium]